MEQGIAPTPTSDKLSESALMLDTVITVTLFGAEDTALIDGCFALCEKYELIFSRTNPESELYRLNESDGMEVSDELRDLLNTALDYCTLTNGAFDITMGEISDMYSFGTESAAVPDDVALQEALTHVGYTHIHARGNYFSLDDPETVIDLGAIAKGYIADRLAEYLTDNGQTSAIIDLGGNIYCLGSKPDGSDYTVGIQCPFREHSQTIDTIAVHGKSVVTSGIYERFFERDGILYHHILDTATGYPVDNGLLAVSIVSDRSVDGDALSTACFALGLEDGLALVNSLEGVEAVFVTEDYALHPSDDFPPSVA